MCIICSGKNLEGMKKLDCSFCPNLTSISNIIGLQILYCNNCPNLTSIPNIEELKLLYCDNCPLLTSIPNIIGLQTLYCNNCANLKQIPNMKRLEILSCNNCCRYMFSTASECVYGPPPWLNHSDNKHYENNITKLIKLQRWFRNRLENRLKHNIYLKKCK